jgi:hypothetical protein
MKQSRWLIPAVGLALALTAVHAPAALRIVEQAVESSTLSVSLPDRDSGSIAVKSCADCRPMLLRLTPSTRFVVGGSEVSYAEFSALARGGTDRSLGVFYDGKEHTITRLVIFSAEFAPTRRRR